jgi:DNA-directed RNA polymerase specialized sigma subunit
VRRYIPRIEGLEAREHLDASLPRVAAPIPCPALATAAPLANAGLDGTAREAFGQELPDPSSQGWQFIERYTRKAIRNDEHRYGALPDHDDIVHQVYLEWRELLGAGSGAYENLLLQDSLERETLRKTVRRVIDRTRYETQRSHRAGAVEAELVTACPEPVEWIDFRIDVDGGVGGLTARERRVLWLRGEGRTVDEIGTELGMAKQRVSELCQHAIASLRRVYSGDNWAQGLA